MSETISVLIPVFNREKYISQCVKSLLGQSYSNIKLIIYDDGSTDKTSIVIKEFAKRDSRIDLIIGVENKGAAFSRNVLIKACKTKYACWQDSDDMANKFRVEFLFDGITQWGKEYLVFSEGIKFVGDDTSEIDLNYKPKRPVEYFLQRRWFATCMFSVSNIPSFVDCLKLGGEDSVWCRTVLELGRKFVTIQEPLYYYRKHSNRIGIEKRRILKKFSKQEIDRLSYKELVEGLN